MLARPVKRAIARADEQKRPPSAPGRRGGQRDKTARAEWRRNSNAPLIQRPEIVVGQQTGALRQRFHQQHAGKSGEVRVAVPERRLIGGDVLDGAQPPFGNAGAGGQYRDRPAGRDNDEAKSPEYR